MNHSPSQSQESGRGEVSLGRRTRRRRWNSDRKGVAAVEFAVVAPIFILLLFGTIEIARMFMVQHLIVNASREGARRAVVGVTSADQVQATVNDYLDDNGIDGATVTVSPDPATVPVGQAVTVTVSVPYDEVGWLPAPWFLGGTTLSASSKMRREGPG